MTTTTVPVAAEVQVAGTTFRFDPTAAGWRVTRLDRTTGQPLGEPWHAPHPPRRTHDGRLRIVTADRGRQRVWLAGPLEGDLPAFTRPAT